MTQQEIEQGRENLPQRLGRVTHDHLPDVQRRLKQINEWINQYSRYSNELNVSYQKKTYFNGLFKRANVLEENYTNVPPKTF